MSTNQEGSTSLPSKRKSTTFVTKPDKSTKGGGQKKPKPPSSKQKGKKPAIPEKARGLLKEQEFPETNQCQFYQVASQVHQLQKLMAPRKKGNLEWVRYFYEHNALVFHDHITLPNTHRKVSPFITEESIREFYGLKEVEQCEFSRLYSNRDSELADDIECTLTVPHSLGWYPKHRTVYLPRASLNAEALVWLLFYCTNIHPTSSHSDLNWETALVLYLFIKEKPVKVEQLIMNKLKDSCKNPRSDASMIFPHLIHDRFIQCGAIDNPEDTHFEPEPKFNYSCLNKFKAPIPPPVPHAPHVALGSDPFAIFAARCEQRFDALEHKVDTFAASYHTDHSRLVNYLVRSLQHLGVNEPYDQAAEQAAGAVNEGVDGEDQEEGGTAQEIRDDDSDNEEQGEVESNDGERDPRTKFKEDRRMRAHQQVDEDQGNSGGMDF